MTDFTKREIKTKFMELLSEKNFDKITVKELVDACGISRNTFYYHYHDIFEVMEDIFQCEIMKVVEAEKRYGSLKEAFLLSTKFAQENRKAMLHLHQSTKRTFFDDYLMRVSDKIIKEYIYQQAEGLEVDENDINLLSVFYKHGLMGILKEMIENGLQGGEEKLIERMAFILEGNIRNSLTKISSK
ncbi:MAG: TetR/AcrR family transcriptional regulator [Anaerovoracaceae bacterium]